MPKGRKPPKPARQTRRYPTETERNAPVAIPLDPKDALRALLAVNLDDEPVSGHGEEREGNS